MQGLSTHKEDGDAVGHDCGFVGPRSGHVMELAITSHAMTTCSQPERAVAGSGDAAVQCVWCTSEKTTKSGAARVLPVASCARDRGWGCVLWSDPGHSLKMNWLVDGQGNSWKN